MRNRLMVVMAAVMQVATMLPLAASAASDVLMVISGHGQNSGETQPGYEFDELAQAYLIFRDNGLSVDIASPQGGTVEADDYDPDKPYNRAFLADDAAKTKLANSRAIGTLSAKDYRAVFVVGGKGAMFDLPSHAPLHQLLRQLWQHHGVVAGVCHGPAAFADLRLADGTPLVRGKAVTGFSNAEERLFGKKWREHFPFQLEDKLVSNGARFEQAEIMLNKVVVDGRLITGQNPYSTTATAEAVVRALGKTPQARTPYPDERSIALLARLLAGEHAWAQTELARASADYDLPLIAMYGYYRLKNAETTASKQQALDIMTIASQHWYHSKLLLALAQGYQDLQQTAQARQVLTQLLAKEPELEAAKQLLAKL